MDWTNDAIEQLRTLWADGHSATRIGQMLGVSKNTIVGKAHRLKLPGRASPIRRRVPGEQGAEQLGRLPAPKLADTKPLAGCGAVAPGQAVRVPAMLEEPKAKPAARPSHAVAREPCCWPIGQPGSRSFRFCGEVAITGRPYCNEHAALAYQPKPVKEGPKRASA